MALSYASGTADQPLLGQTIGENLAETVRRFGDERRLGRAPSGHPLDLSGARRRGRPGGPRAARHRGVAKGDRLGIWSPNHAEWVLVQYATAKLGVILVNINPAYRTHEVAFVLRQSGLPVPGGGHRVQDERLPRDGGRGAGRPARSSSR